MAEPTHIEWTDAAWNPVTGCSVVSPGCANCYAMRLAGTRLQHHESRAGLTTPSKAGPVWNGEVRLNQGWLTQPLAWKRPRRIFVCAHGDLFHESVPDAWIDQVFAVMALAPQHAFQVLTKRSARMQTYAATPTRASAIWRAVGELTDAWEEGEATGFRLPTLAGSPMLAALGAHSADWGGANPWPLRNIWLGVSAEDQTRADERIPDLLATPAAVRFLSAEPLLGPIDLTRWTLIDWQCSRCRAFFSGRYQPSCPDCGALGGWSGSHAFNGRHQPKRLGWPIDRGSGLDWVIAGGESGPGARPMHPDWPRQLRDQCAAAGVPFFFKQWGAWAQGLIGDRGPFAFGGSDGDGGGGFWPSTIHVVADKPRAFTTFGSTYLGTMVGKHAAGRLLDGVAHDAMPAGAPP